MDLEFERKLTIPQETKALYPLTAELAPLVEARAASLRAIFEGQDRRCLLVIGPCSADSADSVLAYLQRLRAVQERVREQIFIVPRVFSNKPRTTGDGYMGLVHQPDASARPDPFKGIIAVRSLHLRALQETGFTCADEMLYPENHRYLDDLLAYVTVGARSVEDQQHRLTASGLGIPVGMKNPTHGDLRVMMNAIHAAQGKHTFIYRGWAVHSPGNPLAHAVLRGRQTESGGTLPNYRYEDLCRLTELYQNAKAQNPAVLIDANHANSGKDPFRQPEILQDVLESCRRNQAIAKLVKGFFVESYLEDGCQSPGGTVFGQSITDPCLGWEKTERLIYDLAERL
ncbi:MAG: 3-deoxy-7-phosphoheptulonate synthase [Oscillospiraceae bacterium]|nr:3-deoxy-7-phosphoheptulonate synthase [Oscillospiraceae bacterium]